MEPGQLFLKETDIICNVGRAASKLNVTNTGDRPVQVGSHFHFMKRMKRFNSNEKKHLESD